MRIVTMTVLCVDFYKQQKIVNMGGNSLNFATQCRNDGYVNVSIIGAVGNDQYGKQIVDYLEQRNIEHSRVYSKAGRTASNTILITEKGERYFPPNAWDGGVYQNFALSDEDWSFALSHDMVAIPGNNYNFLECTTRTTARNLLTVDFLDLRDYELMEKTMPSIDLSFISGDDDVIRFAEKQSRKIDGILTVTLGEEGSISFQGHRSIRQKAIPVRNVKDTTGCGDAYQAAFSTTFFETKSIERSLEAGSIAASKILVHLGAVK